MQLSWRNKKFVAADWQIFQRWSTTVVVDIPLCPIEFSFLILSFAAAQLAYMFHSTNLKIFISNFQISILNSNWKNYKIKMANETLQIDNEENVQPKAVWIDLKFCE